MWLVGWLAGYVCGKLSAAFLGNRFACVLQTQQTSGSHRVGARLSFWRPSDDSFRRFRRVSQQVKTALKRPKTGRNSKTAWRTAAKRSTNHELATKMMSATFQLSVARFARVTQRFNGRATFATKLDDKTRRNSKTFLRVQFKRCRYTVRSI